MSEQARSALTCYRLKITLLDTDPVVSREVQVDGAFTLGALHEFFADVMGWSGERPHQFHLAGKIYMDNIQARRCEGDEIWDEDISICFLPIGKGVRFTYVYDLDSQWKHELVVEDMYKLDKPDSYPMVLDGSGACPPEDCRNISEYRTLLIAHKDPDHAQHKRAKKILGARFNPAKWADKESKVDSKTALHAPPAKAARR